MGPTPASHISAVASHIVDHLLTPDMMFLQEIQDNSGETDDGTVMANLTLSNLVASIAKLSNVTYAFASIDPVNNQDGGVPGGNIRQAYLWVEHHNNRQITEFMNALGIVPKSLA